MAVKTFDNRWEIIETIGEGGQGQVFKVKDLTDGNENYVLKRLKNINRVDRFRNEIEAIKKLEHPNITKLVDSNLEADNPFLVTEYCSGGELTFDKISDFSTIEKLELFSSICKAIGFAHEKGIVHRDIKPANILFKSDKKTPIITDFGICFNTEEGFERLTETIEQVGARYFMAPELADGRAEDITPKADVYSLGKLLYWMFKGRVYDRENVNGEKKYLLPQRELSSNSNFNAIANFVYEIFDNTILQNPNERHTNASELSKSLEQVINILRNEGRFLDADIPSNCVFCGIGKYSKKNIIPKIRKLPSPPQSYGNQEYELDYKQTGILMMSGNPLRLPEGNIKQGLYQHYLVLTCDHCGNSQFFMLGQDGSQKWRNVNPILSE